jgi:hypothetical protein
VRECEKLRKEKIEELKKGIDEANEQLEKDGESYRVLYDYKVEESQEPTRKTFRRQENEPYDVWAKRITEAFEKLKEREQKKEWELAKEFGLHKCFFCRFQEGRGLKYARPITCVKKNKQFAQSYSCKKVFELEVDYKEFILLWRLTNASWRNNVELRDWLTKTLFGEKDERNT